MNDQENPRGRQEPGDGNGQGPVKGNTQSYDRSGNPDFQHTSGTGAGGSQNPNGGSYYFERGGASADGTGYSHSDGTHGYVYTPQNNGQKPRKNRGRGWKIALVTVAAVLVATLCVIGVCSVAASLSRPSGDTDTSGTAEEDVTTSDGLYIDGNGNQTHNGDNSVPNNSRPDHGNRLPVPSIPVDAPIQKRPASRQDADGDGRPDIEFDQNGQVLTSAGNRVIPLPTMVAKVQDSVVEITTGAIVQSGHTEQYIETGAGSGVIISENGFIVTNNHVIAGADAITVRLTDGTQFAATLVGTDEQSDIAVLWIDAKKHPLTVASLGSSYDLVVGEDIIAIGNPLGTLGGTVTEGIVSATARVITVDHKNMTLLQISAPINPGNSGGGLFNMAGDLIGIVNAKCASEEIEGLAFAVPIDTAYQVVLELIDHGYVRNRPTLNVEFKDVTPQMALFYGFDRPGVYVMDSAQKELKTGDCILSVDGVEIRTTADISAIIEKKKVGDTVKMVVYRNQKNVTVTVTVAELVPKNTKSAA